MYTKYTNTVRSTFTSLNPRMSVVKVELTTDGLFLTLGNIIFPFREANLDVLVATFTFAAKVLNGRVVVAIGPDVGAFVVDVVGDGYVVVGIGASVKSSSTEYLSTEWN